MGESSINGGLSIAMFAGGYTSFLWWVFSFILPPHCHLHLGLRSQLVEQLCNYVYDCICNYVIHIITYTHINYYIQLCDTFKPPISTGVLVVPGGTLILLKNRKAADGQDNFSESEREREREI